MSTLNLRSLSVEINEIDQRKQLDNYIGHLRRENRVKALRQFYFLVPDSYIHSFQLSQGRAVLQSYSHHSKINYRSY